MIKVCWIWSNMISCQLDTHADHPSCLWSQNTDLNPKNPNMDHMGELWLTWLTWLTWSDMIMSDTFRGNFLMQLLSTMVHRGIEIAPRSWNIIFVNLNRNTTASEFPGYILMGLYYTHVNYLGWFVSIIHCKMIAKSTKHRFLSKTGSVGPKMHQKTPKKLWSDHTQ
jgi:hypothetical protein